MIIAGVLLILPDGRLVLNRRSKDAPTDSGLLSIFGGHAEPGEKPEQTAQRELHEETSITQNRQLESLGSYELNGNIYHAFKAHIQSSDFKVYEGVGAETYTLAEALELKDLAHPAEYSISKLKGE